MFFGEGLMKAGFIQMTPVFGDVEANLILAEQLIRSTSADLLVLPELFNTGYLFTDFDDVRQLSENIPDGKTTRQLRRISRETGTALVAGLPERFETIYYNSAVLVTPDDTIHLYRKTHLFDREKMFFQPGDTGFNVFEFNGIRIGIMICFDWFFPESCRSLALFGAQVVAHPSNLVLPHCPNAMITRCLENRVFAITANRAGYETRGGCHLDFIGNSRIINPLGEILGKSDTQNNSCVVVRIDPLEADQKGVTEQNHILNDRRPDKYHPDLYHSY
jgi:predicted amidohydrolase